MSVRTNLLTNPRYIGTDTLNGSWGGTPNQVDLATGAPDGRGYTKITLTADQTGSAYVSGGAANAVPASEGDVLTFSSWFTRPRLGHVDVRIQWRDAADALISQEIQAFEFTASDLGQWRRVLVTGTAPAGTEKVWVVSTFSNATLLNGDEVGVAQRMLGDDGDYFDGDTPDTALVINDWTADPDASTSTQTAVEIEAALLTTDQPQPVQVLVTDVPMGEGYVVEGVTGDGLTWSIPGGEGVSDGGQVRLVDNRGPVNTAVTYRVTVSQAILVSNQVTIPWAPAGDDSPRFLIQSLDGSIIVPVRQWWDNGLPKEPEIRSTKFPIRGRRRPVVVQQPAGDGDSPVQVVLSREAGERLQEILGIDPRTTGATPRGGAVCIRTTGNERDLAPTDLAVIMASPSSLFPNDGVSTSRLWELTLTWIDDPEPSSIPTVWTWDEVDELLGVTMGLTWDQVDEMFNGLTWDDVDATDWGSVS